MLATILSIMLALFPCIGQGARVVAQVQPPDGNAPQSDAFPRDTNLAAASALVTERGVVLEWRTNLEKDNLGFDIYRVRNGQRVRANRTIIPGSVFIVGQDVMRAGNSYQWFDAEGTADSIYYIESQSSSGNRKLYDRAITVSGGKAVAGQQQVEALKVASANDQSGAAPALKEYPSSLAGPQSTEGTIDTQWNVAAQSALKIRVNHDGWYRVTQQQMSLARFNPVVNIENLSLFADGQETAIRTSKATGQLLSGDYLEFYGRGLDTPATDSRIYYLIAGTQAGKRASADLPPDDSVVARAATESVESKTDLTYRGWFGPLVSFSAGEKESPTVLRESTQAAHKQNDSGNDPAVSAAAANAVASPASSTPVARFTEFAKPQASGSQQADKIVAATVSATATGTSAPQPATKRMTRARQRRSRKHARDLKLHYSHASYLASGPALSFNYTARLKERLVYFIDLLNGDAENYFGQVIATNPVTGTVPAHNIVSGGSANLVVALQGIQSSNPSHQVNVFLNDVMLGTISFSGLEHPVQTFTIPTSQLREGNNAVKMTHVANGDVSIVDYLNLTYPHAYRVDSTAPRLRTEAILVKNSLRFTLDSAQSATVEGFSKPSVRLLDISDPANVKISHYNGVPKGSEYSITVPTDPSTSGLRNLYALLEWQFETPAGFSLNQPSTLNLNSNGADLLIISYKDFIPSLAPLISKRQLDGLTVKVVDVEDVYDEFSYGAHSSQALKDFLSRTVNPATQWNIHPRYVLFVGDASYDPRNYEGFGNWDLVPTRLIDTAFEETCSDDALADFDGNGIADIPVGRLPARTPAEADLMVSKIVNFQIAHVAQTAMLVADAQCGYAGGCAPENKSCYYFDFAQANSEVAALLPASITVHSVNRQTLCPDQQPGADLTTRNDVINSFNQGVALVNYTGHGNLNVWTGASIFTTADARALTNGNHLPFVVVADCLNGLFDDRAVEGLGEAFLKAPNGGAVGVFASSGRTLPDGQQQMSKALYPLLFGSPAMAVGDAAKQAKLATSDIDVRRTWILLGDPSMKIW